MIKQLIATGMCVAALAAFAKPSFASTLSVEQQLSRAFEDAKKHKKQNTSFTIYSNSPIRKATVSRSLRLVMKGVRPKYKGIGLHYSKSSMKFRFLYKESLYKWAIKVKPLKKTKIEDRKH